MADLPPHRYFTHGLKQGVEPCVLEHAAEQIETSEFAGVTPILSLRHLSHLTGTGYAELRQVVARHSDPYIDLTLPKRTGVRPISIPAPTILAVQRFLLARALCNLDLHPRSYAYRVGRSTFACAEVHVGARWIIKMDLRNFFGSITEKDVYRVFKSQGYSKLVAFELSRLCTRASATPGSRRVLAARNASRYRSAPYVSDWMGTLPQGAPTSGALANAVATPLDHDMHRVASDAGFIYTRYSDDLTFSTSKRVGPARAQELIRAAARTAVFRGFQVNPKKTRVLGPRTRHDVLGLVVGEERVQLPPEFRRKIEVHIHGVKARGPAAHAEMRGFRSVFGMVAHVDGCIAYAIGIDAEWARLQQGRWAEALRTNGYPI